MVPTEANGLDENIPVCLRNHADRDFEIPKGLAVADCVVLPTALTVRKLDGTVSENCGPFQQDFQVHSVEIPVGTTEFAETGSKETTGSSWEWEPPNFLDALKPIVLDTPLENEDNGKVFQALLFKYRDAFSLNGEIGCTNAIVHRIPTGNATPVRQAPRRLPFHGGYEVGMCMKEMLEGKIIEGRGE